MKVLLAESDGDFASSLCETIRQAGFSVAHTPTGKEALEQSLAESIQIIVANRELPDMSGTELGQAFDEAEGGRRHLILFGGDGQESAPTEESHSVEWRLRAPIDTDDFIAKLRGIGRMVRVEREAQEKQVKVEQIQSTLELANKSLTIASRRFEELFRGLPVAAFTFGGDGKIHEWNRDAERLFGMQAFQVFDREVWDVMGEASTRLWNSETVSSVIAGRTITRQEWTYVDTYGREHFLVCNVIPLTGGTGKIVGAISANIDITDRVLAERQIEWQIQEIREQKAKLEEANRQLERLAQTDGLTGLTNRRHMFELLDEYCTQDGPLSAILLDVDFFKSFNDTFGHLAGDQVLRDVAEVASKAVGERGTVARYGGEEFAVLLPWCSQDEAMQIAERIRAAIESLPCEHRQVTASLGVATLSGGKKAPELLRQSDEALYRAKGTGKNRAAHFGSMMHEEPDGWSKAA